MSYAGGVGRAPTTASPLSLLPFLGLAVVLSAARLLATTLATTGGISVRIDPATAQIWIFAAIWIAGYIAEGFAGWLLWKARARPSGRAALVLFWITLGVQALRLLNLLGTRLTAGQLPWSAFGTVVLLDVVVAIAALTAWHVSKRAGAILWIELAWFLYVTAISGADALLKNGLPLT